MTDAPHALGNADQAEAWNGPSGHRWVTDADRRDRIYAPVADALLARAAPRPGEAVLDVGCGCGATTLAAAAAVAPGGAATGLDLSGPMLDVARRRARAAGQANVTFTHGDAQAHPLSAGTFDLAISRFGTMFFADPVAAFANVARALRPGGRLTMATWAPLAANPWLTVPAGALGHDATAPRPDEGSGMFAQSDPDRVGATLAVAGYRDVEVEPVDVTLPLGADVDEAADYVTAVGVARAALEALPAAERPAALADVRTALAAHVGPGGVRLGARILVTRARRGG